MKNTRQKSAIDIIRSKLTTPMHVEAIARPRLVRLMSSIPDHRLTVVAAGAGYGKSTLVAQACQQLGINSLWYKLEKSDCDFMAFVHYLIAGLQGQYPGFGESVIADINTNNFLKIGDMSGVAKAQPTILARLTREMEEMITEKTLVVLDDFHELGDDEEICNAVLFLVEHAPPNVHLVIISRTDPDMPLSRLRAGRKVLDIGKSDLVFTEPEIKALFQMAFGMSLSESWLQTLHHQTEGWITGLILFYHYAKVKTESEIEDLLAKTGGNNKIIAAYMQENLWAGQPESVQRFLMETSIHSVIDVDMVDTLLDRSDARRILKTLEAQHLFTSAVDDTGCYFCYHQLLQQFLQNKLVTEMGKRHFQLLHKKTARYYESLNNLEKALEHFLAAEDYDNFFRILGPTGQTLVQKGRFRRLESILEKIQPPYDTQEPWVLYYKASIFFAAGQFQEVVHLARQAYEGFMAQNEMDGARLCLMDMGQANYWLGDVHKAEAIFKELLQTPPLSPEVQIKTLGHLVLTAAWCGDMPASDRHYECLAQVLKSQGTTDEMRILSAWADVCHGFRYQFAGDFIKSVEKGNQALNAIGNLETGQSLAFCYQLLGISFFFLGEFDKSTEVSEKGLQLVVEKGFVIYEAWYLTTLALIDLHSDRLEDARQKATRAFEIFSRFGSQWGKAFSVMALFPVQLKTGSKKDIEAIALDAIRVASEIQCAWFEGKAYYFSAIEQMQKNAFEESQQLIDRSKETAFPNFHDLCLIDMVQANLHLKQGKQKLATDLFLDAMARFQENRYGLWVIRYHAQWMMPLIVRIYATGKLHDFLVDLLTGIGRKAIPLLKEIQDNEQKTLQEAASDILTLVFGSEGSSLRLNCLGRFRVFVNDLEIPDTAWKSRKAKQLFQYLVLSRPKGTVLKEELMAFLWPGDDPEKAINRLRVTITMLRKTLEPDLKQWTKSSFLERKDGGYAIYLGPNGCVDIDDFESKVQQANRLASSEKKLKMLLEALSIYQGDLLEESLYEEWTFSERERLRATYLKALKAVVDIYADMGAHEKSVSFAYRYLEKDGTAEPVYQRLMRCYAEMGNKAMIAKTYKACKQQIAERLKCSPSDMTNDLYNQLIGQEKQSYSDVVS
ncbi:MAG: BTAD domain-containing putative transcriptional regulator [Thermodesulfobacteriota bacterium]|nr:BTAD domain-containing putative transcriptional regulator [Thermodesulfobacteriota bacterium]